LSIVVTAANTHDKTIALETIDGIVHRLRVYLDTPVTDSWSERRVRYGQAAESAIG
jgi:hypothetical protein